MIGLSNKLKFTKICLTLYLRPGNAANCCSRNEQAL